MQVVDEDFRVQFYPPIGPHPPTCHCRVVKGPPDEGRLEGGLGDGLGEW